MDKSRQCDRRGLGPRHVAQKKQIYLTLSAEFCPYVQRTNKIERKMRLYRWRDIAKPLELAYQEVNGRYTKAPFHVLTIWSYVRGSHGKNSTASRKALKL
jgi:hypothetical protein